MDMSATAANEYRLRATPQQIAGQKFVEEEVQLKRDNTVLDIGCGTGNLTAFVAQHLLPEGKVIGVDPDSERIKIAQETYKHVKNLTFVVGSSDDFPGMERESYDVILAVHVLHWVENKTQLFVNAYQSLKRGGKIAFLFNPVLPPAMEQAFNTLAPEQSEHILSKYHFEDIPTIAQYCSAAGFIEIDTKVERKQFTMATANKHDFIMWLSATTHGAFDPSKVTKEQLDKFTIIASDARFLEFGRLFAVKD